MNRKMKENLSLAGQVVFSVFKAGQVRPVRKIVTHNKITNFTIQYGLELLTNSIPSMPPLFPTKMQLGTGTGMPAATDLDLWVPSAGTLKPLAQTQIYQQYYAQYICNWQSSDPIQGTWTEAGLKDGNGNLWAHVAFASGLLINPGEMLVGQWQIQVSGD